MIKKQHLECENCKYKNREYIKNGYSESNPEMKKN